MTKIGYIDYFPGEPLRKVAHRSVCSSKTVLPLKRCRAVARKSIPPRRLTLKKKPAARWSSNYCASLSVSDCNHQSYDSESGSSAMSCCSSEASNVPTWSSSNYSNSLSVSDEDCNNYNQSSADSDCSSLGSCSCLSYYSTGASNHPPTQPIVYVLCKLVDGVLVRV